MARFVTISSLGPVPLHEAAALYGDNAVYYMIKHWQEQIAPVLADKPDLIVLPEACGRCPQHSIEERKAY
ncbi:MAG: hypothetical protein ACYC2P_13485 [Paludibacteraceae bacterium]